MKNNFIDSLPEGKVDSLLESGNLLNIKIGFDPTGPDLHLGHLVLLNKALEFQDLGHTITVIIGDFTASIGDPTGKNKSRPALTSEEIQDNTIKIKEQILKILNPAKTSIVFNSTWFSEMSLSDIMGHLGKVTVSQILDRNDFSNRLSNGDPLGMHEIVYPLLQGLDSVFVKSDIEIGGTDQLFNLNFGRNMQTKAGMKSQAILTMPIINGTCGVNKMSKSLNNHIPLLENPRDMFGKVMSVSDEVMLEWIPLFAPKLNPQDIHPMEAKKALSFSIVESLHCLEAAESELEFFNHKFSDKKNTEAIEFSLGDKNDLFSLCKAFSKISGSEVLRLISQGAIRVNNIKSSSSKDTVNIGDIVRIGKKKEFKLGESK